MIRIKQVLAEAAKVLSTEPSRTFTGEVIHPIYPKTPKGRYFKGVKGVKEAAESRFRDQPKNWII